jgi:hypothetical protein
MKVLRKILTAAIVSTLGFSSMALAGTLTTPTLFAGSAQNVCVATNVGPTPVTVTVEMVTLLNGTTQETCTITRDDPGGCQNAANDLAYCRVLVPGTAKNIRAVMMNRQTAQPFTINTTVEAR